MKDRKMPHASRFKWSLILDYIVFPLLLIWFIYQPDFMHGFIVDHFESGKELVCINEVLHGKALYKDTIPYFGPLCTYLQTLFMLAFGTTIASLKAYFYAGTLSLLVISYLVGYRLFRSRLFAYLLALSLAVETINPYWSLWWGGFRFGFGMAAILFFIAFLEKGKRAYAFLTGMFIAVALLTSIDVGVMSAISIIFTYYLYAWRRGRESNTQPPGHASWFLFGIASIAAPFVLYCLKKNALFSYLETTYILVTNHIKVWGTGGMVINLKSAFAFHNILTVDFKVAAVAFLYVFTAIYMINRFRKNILQWPDYGIICLSIYGLLMYKASFRAVLGPQFEMALQPALIVLLFFMSRLWGSITDILRNNRKIIPGKPNREKKPLALVSLSIVLILISTYLIFSEKVSYRSVKDFITYQKHKDYFMPLGRGFLPLNSVKFSTLTVARAKNMKMPSEYAQYVEGATKYISRVTNPDEKVFTFPDLALINFLADRPSLDRFGIAIFAWTWRPWREELLNDLRRLKPRYIVRGNGISSLASSIKRKTEFLPEVIDYMNSNYYVEASFGPVDILRSKYK
ncbi:MAG: hypothetical protein KKH77_00855 [Candidatus Omnitrophica bacterium]|nr:hypothetical protein [Candidatus Omnitrophota bacterium]